MKVIKSITLDPDINKGIEEEAKRQRLKFSTLVNRVLNEYLISLDKEKQENKQS